MKRRKKRTFTLEVSYIWWPGGMHAIWSLNDMKEIQRKDALYRTDKAVVMTRILQDDIIISSSADNYSFTGKTK